MNVSDVYWEDLIIQQRYECFLILIRTVYNYTWDLTSCKSKRFRLGAKFSQWYCGIGQSFGFYVFLCFCSCNCEQLDQLSIHPVQFITGNLVFAFSWKLDSAVPFDWFQPLGYIKFTKTQCIVTVLLFC